jgi:hypothetical protein
VGTVRQGGLLGCRRPGHGALGPMARACARARSVSRVDVTPVGLPSSRTALRADLLPYQGSKAASFRRQLCRLPGPGHPVAGSYAPAAPVQQGCACASHAMGPPPMACVAVSALAGRAMLAVSVTCPHLNTGAGNPRSSATRRLFARSFLRGNDRFIPPRYAHGGMASAVLAASGRDFLPT